MVTRCHIIVSLESIDYFESRKAAGQKRWRRSREQEASKKIASIAAILNGQVPNKT